MSFPIELNPEDVISMEESNVEGESSYAGEFRITNTSDRQVGFKVKTTVPRNYIVKPTSGVLEPNDGVTVHLARLPMESSDKGDNDRFMIQCFKAEEDGDPLTHPIPREIWQKLAEEKKVHDRRLFVKYPVVLKPPADSMQEPSVSDGPKGCLSFDSGKVPKAGDVAQREYILQLEREIAALRPKGPAHDEEVTFSLFQVLFIVIISIALLKLLRMI